MAYEQTFDDVVTGNAADATVEALNTYLRGELSAVETYKQAVDKIDDEFLRASLNELSVSHEQRVGLLRGRIESLGGEPAKSSGVWGGFAKVVEGGAKIFGVKAALAALEEGEDHGLKMYRDDLDGKDASLQAFVLNELLPAQQRSHDEMSNLKHSVH
jgi:uncharacterized protein (TIGR02284 family)